MPSVGEVSFELERFEWTADDRLEVVGRWNGVGGRRIGRPALTVDAGGRRQRVSGTQVSEPDEPWRASFDWDADRGDVLGAELEVGRSLVVELPPLRRRRRRSAASAESDLRIQVEELRSLVTALQARPTPEELEALQAEIASLRAAEPAGDADRVAELEADLAEARAEAAAPEV